MVNTIACDLRHMFGNSRDQYNRPTCMAFAVSDAHAAMRPNWRELSCEYIFYRTVQFQGSDPNHGVNMEVMLDVVREIGQPLEHAWPYLSNLPDNLENWQAPKIDGIFFKRNYNLLQITTDQVFRCLDSGVPVVLTFCLSDAFFFSYWDENGKIDDAYPPNQALCHAVVAVGYMNSEDQKFVLIRNSWGENWCINGYGCVSERYLSSALLRIAILTEDMTNVPPD